MAYGQTGRQETVADRQRITLTGNAGGRLALAGRRTWCSNRDIRQPVPSTQAASLARAAVDERRTLGATQFTIAVTSSRKSQYSSSVRPRWSSALDRMPFEERVSRWRRHSS